MNSYTKLILLLMVYAAVFTGVLYVLIKADLDSIAVPFAAIGIGVGFYGYSKAGRLLKQDKNASKGH